MIIRTDLDKNGYDIVIEKGSLGRVNEYFDLNRRVMIVTDEGVPSKYSKTVASLCKTPFICTLKQGEENKSLEGIEKICKAMLEGGFDRNDAVVAVGGGIVGDMAGFAASVYMRGIDFYNIPTTVLSAVDSSVGGKTAVNFCGVKNILGAFYQPKKVLIDIDTLKTLPRRQISNGLAEALKMALTFDKELFDLFQKGDPEKELEKVIAMSLGIKSRVVSMDEKEKGLRKVLNFGHTIGHGIESVLGFDGGLYHGECVALGMLYVSSTEIRKILLPIYEKTGLPSHADFDKEKVFEAVIHDKKSADGGIDMIFCNEVGRFEIIKTPLPGVRDIIFSENLK